MREVFIISDNIVSPLGTTTAQNFERLCAAASGIQIHNDGNLSAVPFYASLFNNTESVFADTDKQRYTKFEQLLIASVKDALENSNVDPSDKRTLLIISTTKGNVSLLETDGEEPLTNKRLSLHHSASMVAEYFKFTNKPIVVSNACISGLLAIITAMRMVRRGLYDNAVVVGADVISKFVLSGFQSFQAISAERCKPFDAARTGINLGEGAATVVLSATQQTDNDIKVTGGAVSNDANHISGPSRTGEELHQAITNSMYDAGVTAADIGFVSAHGTATIYNDEMESKAITLAGLQQVPVNSLKGYYGHTLGAAGLIEAVISVQSLKQNLIIPTLGFNNMGVSMPITICTSLQKKVVHNFLKTASGFGGCNAAVMFGKQ